MREQDAVIRALCAETGVDASSLTVNSGLIEDEKALIRDGKEIQAVKAYRERTGAGLKEAHDVVMAHRRPA